MKFKEDRIENEKNDPTEGSSLRFINLPLVLISLFIGFGVSYLFLKTPDVTMNRGDSHSAEKSLSSGIDKVENNEIDETALIEKGKQVFVTSCQACHQANGEGIAGAFPPLGGSEWVTGPAEQTVAIVIRGVQGEITVKNQKYNGVMPAFSAQLKPADIAAVVSYVRSSFGNSSGVVSTSLVEEVVRRLKDKTGAWNGESDLKLQNWSEK